MHKHSHFSCMSYEISDKATNPAMREEDTAAISAFCDQINKELEGAQIAVRLLAHKIQSPQERESLYALSVSEHSVFCFIVVIDHLPASLCFLCLHHFHIS